MSGDWQFLVALNERLRPLRDPVEIQEVVVRLVGDHLQASRVNYAQIEGDEFVVVRWYAPTVAPFAVRGHVARFGRAIVDACRRGETVVVSDVKTDPRFMDAERAQLLADEIEAFVSVPITKQGRWVATFGVQSTTPRTWTRDEIALVELTSERTWGAGERARAEEALEAAAGGCWTWVVATNRVDWDKQFRLLYGFAADEPATPEGWITRVHEDDRPQLLALRKEMWASKTKD